MAPLEQQRVGEHVRRLRARAGASLRTLARQTGFSASFLSQVENGRVSPSISSMEKIAGALGASLSEFFAAAAGGEGGLVVRAADRQAMSSGWSKADVEALSLGRSTARLEANLDTLRPGGRSGRHPYPHPREEFAFVLQGEVMLRLGLEEHRLRRGDAAAILPGELRLWRNEARRPAMIMIITSPGRGAEARGRRTPRATPRAAQRGEGAPTSFPASGRRRRGP